MDITLTFTERAQGKARPRFTNGYAYTPAKTRAFEARLSTAFKFRMLTDKLKPTDKPVLVSVVAYFKPPLNAPKTFKNTIKNVLTPYNKKPDADNILKAVLDACNGIVYLDDKQCAISCYKFYASRDYFVVRITDEYTLEAPILTETKL